MAQRVSRGELEINQPFVHESIIGSRFTGRAIEEVAVGDYPGIVPEITGWARVTGENRIIIDSRDPYSKGFLLGSVDICLSEEI